jgi:hypothetical protein
MLGAGDAGFAGVSATSSAARLCGRSVVVLMIIRCFEEGRVVEAAASLPAAEESSNASSVADDDSPLDDATVMCLCACR